jgi:diguanylate cyclase (GGDEF)-like protein/PAS domain S-box-containing protein
MNDPQAHRRAKRLSVAASVLGLSLLLIVLLWQPLHWGPEQTQIWPGVHLLLEMSSTAVALMVATVTWASLDRQPLRSLGVIAGGFMVVAFCDLFHALSFVGMPALLSPSGAEKTIFYWLSGRVVEALTLLCMSVGLKTRTHRVHWVAFSILAMMGLLWVGCYHLDWVPQMYSEVEGLTILKMGIEGAVAILNLVTGCVFWRRAGRSGRPGDYHLATACFLLALGGLAFASYRTMDDSINALGHLIKLAADWLIFQSVCLTCIQEPYQLASRSEQALRDREAQLSALAQNLPNGALFQICIDSEGGLRLVYVSHAIERLTGVSANQGVLDPDKLSGRFSVDERRRLKGLAQQAAMTLGVVDTVTQMMGRDGQWCSLRVCAAARDFGEGVVMLDGLLLDITDQTRGDEARRNSEAVLRAMIDNMPIEAWVRDETDALVLENPAHVRHFGSMLGEGVASLALSESEMSLWQRHATSARSGEVVSYESQTEIGDNKHTFFHVMAPLILDGRVQGLVGFNLDISRRTRAESAARDKDARLASILREMPCGVSRLDVNLVFLFVNGAHAKWFGFEADEMVGQPLSKIVSPQRFERMLPFVQRALSGEVVTFENKVELLSGTTHFRHTTLAPERALDGSVIGFVAFAIDTTERRLMELELEQNQLRIRALINALPDMVSLKDAAGVYQYCNLAFERFIGRVEAGIVGHCDEELFPAVEARQFRRHDLDVLSSDKALIYEEDLTFYDGTQGRFETIKTPLRDAAGRINGILGVSRDITERKRAEREIERLAFFDVLTDLPNRRLLIDRLEHACLASSRSGHHGALLFIDLDNFKDLNDTLGHDMGDQLLIQVARRLSRCVRQIDTVARFGGDEFVLMIEELSLEPAQAADQAERVAEKLLGSLNEPFELKKQQFYSTPSVGITLFQGHHHTVDELLKRADLAMYQAKASGRNTLRFFDPGMQAAVTARAVLEGDLRQGLVRHELILYFQPIVDDAQNMTGVEALVRWAHPQRGMVSPGEFIPLAEQTGLILPLGAWVLEQACLQLVTWGREPLAQHLSVSVNVSARQFRHPGFVGLVREVIARTGANPQRIQLELTESLLLTDVEDMIAKMAELRMEGVRFSLDDFGTGYSSLSYLKRLPLDQLKIDQSFVRDVLVDPNDAAIVRTVLALAGSLDLSVVAEGVETSGQLDFLRQCGCRAFQGYLFGRPVPVDALEQMRGLRSFSTVDKGSIHG